MTCEKVEPELVGYHFGLLPDDLRVVVETHLVSCSTCLRAFVDVKRAIEIGEDGPLPSKAAHARLRLAVATELGVPTAAPAGTTRRRWERPLAFAIAASFVLLANRATRAMTSGPGSPPHAISEGRVLR